MSFLTSLSPLLKLLFQWTGSYGLSIILCFVMIYIVALPFRLLKRSNDKKKKKIAPMIKEAQSKYHINALGPDTTHDDTLPPEIRKMSKNERQEALQNELTAIRKEAKYYPVVSWIPGLIVTILSFILLFSVSAACPEGPYRNTFSTITSEGVSGHIYELTVLIVTLLTPTTISVVSLIKKKVFKTTEPAHKKDDDAGIANGETAEKAKSGKTAVISAVISLAVTLGFGIYIFLRAAVASAFTLTLLQFGALGLTLFSKLKKSKNNETQE